MRHNREALAQRERVDRGERRDMADEGNVRPDERDEGAKAGVDVAATLKDGLFAVRDVHLAARRHSSARARLRSMREAVEADGQTLARREEVEAGYDDIVSVQRSVIADALGEISRQQALPIRVGWGRVPSDPFRQKKKAPRREPCERVLNAPYGLDDASPQRSR